jgi:eukaryotic-like serine/threonine-protein kinase
MGLPATAHMATASLGRYQILSELGQGAMGTVYKAIDPLIERTVAIKTITLGISKEEFKEFEERFYREAKSAGRLNHPNIVTIFDIGNTGNVAWIAMELLEGRSLREIIDSGAVLPAEKIAQIGAQVAEGLAAAHAAHVVHRDIKPANIMIQSNGHAKITDFGVALIPATSRTLDGVILGSPKYMSPEHVVGRAVDGRSDIFSLGSVLYELLAGRPPFAADHVANLMYKVLNELPPAPSTIFRSVPPGLDYIVAKAMAKHPDDRYASADLLAADLRRYRKLPPPPEPAAKPRTLERRRSKRSKPEELSLDQQTVVEELVPGRRTALADDDIIDITAAPSGRRKPAANDDQPGTGRRPVLLALAGAAALAAVAYLSLESTPEPVPPSPAAVAPPVAAAPAAASPAPIEPPAVPAADPAVGATDPAKQDAPAATLPRAADATLSRNADAPAAKRVAPRTDGTVSRATLAGDPKAAAASVANGDSASSQAGASGTAQIEFAVTPWGEIYVNGKRHGTTPPDSQVSLSAGTHRIEIRNGDFPPHVQTVELKPGQSLKLKHRFAP